MRRVPQKILVCLLSAGMVCGPGCVTSFAAEAEDVGIQTLSLTPEVTTKPYHGYSFGNLEISGAEEVSLDMGESIILTITPYAHVQYVGCSKGELCGPGLCNNGDESVFHCWEENKGCICDFRYDVLRLATVTVETDRAGILSCEEICDYSSLETAGDMTDGQVVLTAAAEGMTTVTVKVSLYDWVDAEATFTVVVNAGESPEDPSDENPNAEDPGVVEPGPEDPGDGDSGTDNPEPEPEPEQLQGLNKADGKWGYYVDGEVDTSYTGFAHNGNGDWYVVNGYVNFDQNSVFKDTTGVIGAVGTWYYVVGSKVQQDFTGLANYKNANGWWYIANGKVDFTHNGVDKNKNGWYYVTDGKVRFDFTGLANYKNTNGWWYIRGGKVDFSINTVAKNNNGWWYVTGGKVQFGFTGLANYKNANGWWYIKGGKVDFTYKGIAANKNGTWYVNGGKVQFGYSGAVTSGGKIYTVKNGKIN